MSGDFQTIGTFQNAVEANLAKNRLEAAGIPAYLEGEETAATAWPFVNPLGGVRLLVAAKDTYRAHACLVDPSAPANSEAAELTAAAESTGITLERNPPATTGITLEPTAPAEEEDAGATATVREQNAARALRGAVLGLIFWPLQAYVFYLLFRVYLSDEELGKVYRRRAWVAAAINLPFVLISAMVFRACAAD